MKSEVSHQRHWIYWLLIGGALAVSAVSIWFYVSQFGGNGLANDSGMWADFGAYLSGTVGVTAVTFTLFALILTLRQQDSLLAEQRRQVDQASINQSRISAYQRVESLLPEMKRLLDEHLNKRLIDLVGREFIIAFDVKHVSPQERIVNFFLAEEPVRQMARNTVSAQHVFGSVLSNEAYEFARFSAYIVRDAPELRYYVLRQVKDYRFVIRCAMAFKRKDKERVLDDKEEWEMISRTFNLPFDYSGFGDPESLWQELGRSDGEQGV
ncbi:hypothetical protein [Chromohalobacter israelensis]|uniref:hypothetical protein n=1 Tax=Chromohalobacter israelensis TaxID=141390 RepID=UPI001CC6D25B|nr:hypothetical protein [Chromohalobacter salexigens]MBZ5876005.1 hypothetical protein [Chromohalobacter salexigens]